MSQPEWTERFDAPPYIYDIDGMDGDKNIRGMTGRTSFVSF